MWPGAFSLLLSLTSLIFLPPASEAVLDLFSDSIVVVRVMEDGADDPPLAEIVRTYNANGGLVRSFCFQPDDMIGAGHAARVSADQDCVKFPACLGADWSPTRSTDTLLVEALKRANESRVTWLDLRGACCPLSVLMELLLAGFEIGSIFLLILSRVRPAAALCLGT